MTEGIRNFSYYLFPFSIANSHRATRVGEVFQRRLSLQKPQQVLWSFAVWSTVSAYDLATHVTSLVANQLLLPVVRIGGEAVLTKAVNGLARAAACIGFGTIQEIKKVENLEQFTHRNEPPPTDIQIKEEVEGFGNNIARLISMRLIDQVLCRSRQPEDFYLELVYRSKCEEEWKKVFFTYLDRSQLIFPVRVAAKMGHLIFFPFVKKTLHDTALSILEHITSYLYVNEKKEFNDLFSNIMKKWELLLEDWVKALKIIANNPSNDGVESAGRVLEEELKSPKYHAKMPPNEFYDKVTKKAVARYYPRMSLGKMIFQRLTSIEAFSSQKSAFGKIGKILIRTLNICIWVFLFPLALAAHLFLLVPEYFFHLAVSIVIQKAMIRNRVFENILKRALQGISTNKGLSTPLLKALTTSLREFLVEVRRNGHSVGEILLNEDLSVNNQKDLQRNLGLFLSAADLYSYKTIAELRKKIHSSTFLIEEGTKGIEDIIILLSQKARNANFIKQELYFIFRELNHSFISPNKTPDERDREFLDLEKQLSALVKTLLTESITKKVAEVVFFLKEGEAGHNWVVNYAQKEIYSLVEKVFSMVSSPNFLKYQLNAALSDFLHAE